MKYILSIIVLMLFVIGSARAYAVELNSELEKKVSINFEGMSLEKAIQTIGSKTNLEIIPLNSITNNDRLNSEKIFLSVKDMGVGQLLDWLARSIGARYKMYSDGRIYLSQNYEWVEVNKFGMLFVDLKSIVSGAAELDDFDKNLNEFTKIISLFDDNYYVRIEEQADMIKLIAHTPKELKPIFYKIINMMNTKGDDVGSFEVESNNELQKFYNKIEVVKDVNYPYLPLNVILQRLENDFGVNIGCVNAVYNKSASMPEISLKIGSVSLKEAIESVVEKTSLNGVEISMPNGIWLTRYESNWYESASKQFLWADNIVFRAYNISDINGIVPGKLVAEQLVNNVATRAWYDPMASLMFHEKTGNLIVIADKNTQQRVLVALKDLMKRLGLK